MNTNKHYNITKYTRVAELWCIRSCNKTNTHKNTKYTKHTHTHTHIRVRSTVIQRLIQRAGSAIPPERLPTPPNQTAERPAISAEIRFSKVAQLEFEAAPRALMAQPRVGVSADRERASARASQKCVCVCDFAVGEMPVGVFVNSVQRTPQPQCHRECTGFV